MKLFRTNNFAPLAIAVYVISASPAAACDPSMPISIVVHTEPPAGLTDPAEIARWETDQAAMAQAYKQTRHEQLVREQRTELAAFAAETASMDAGRLADDLAANLTPPVKASFASKDSCGGLREAPVFDPAGYYWRSDFTDLAIERGVVENVADARAIPSAMRIRLLRRTGESMLGRCLDEARQEVSAALLRRFSKTELARAMKVIRRNAFDRIAGDRGRSGSRYPEEYRLLAFVEGRSGPLEFNRNATANRTWRDDEVRHELAPKQRDRMKAFFAEDPLGGALVEEVQSVVSRGTALCPLAMQAEEKFWDEVRLITQDRIARGVAKRQARSSDPTS